MGGHWVRRLRGRRRSMFCADMAGQYLEAHGFPVMYMHHHCRIMEGLDDRGMCGCREGHCRFQRGRAAHPRGDWQRSQMQARRGVFEVVSTLLDSLDPGAWLEPDIAHWRGSEGFSTMFTKTERTMADYDEL